MKKIVSLLALIGLVNPLFAIAEDNGALLTYDYLDAEYRHTYNQGAGIGQTDALGLTVSHAFGKYVFGFLDYDTGSTNLFSTAFKTTTFTYGVGARTAVAKNVDAIAAVAGTYSNIDADGLSDIDDRGIDLTFGVRTLPFETLEVDLRATFSDNDFADDGWTYATDLLVPLGCTTALKSTIAMDDESNVGVSGGFRFAY
jgi:hypothetical protein